MARIQVIGESCIDIFTYCDATRLAPDLPVPVLQILNTERNPGMAANVHRNIQTKLPSATLITNSNWESLLKNRFMHESSNHMFLRVDSPHLVEPIDLNEIDFSVDIIVISDYNKGFLSESAINEIAENHDLVFLDTKKNLGPWADRATFIKINDFEYNGSRDFLTETLRNKIIHTCGPRGCNFLGVNYPVERLEVKDSSGAGDSFLAALVVEYSESKNIISSIVAANLAASKIVGTRGVGTI
jgi:D-beta-D-heptose 7-phosphate kinase/D-beta-D-heptose 1-phosphate adenosyltransferase